ncbi:hypothetical protein MKW98_031231 [Papaver atlanticum]|uniref:Uncharacterized protein n=1 Tax=Papaver atlanticum TaxID=357466 RepID=A0AAD4SAX9_9MAGN|nr:hypothetical protein MKW98_031231 [Papaver atlanticum]
MVMNGNNDSSKGSKDDNGGHNVYLTHDIIIYNILTGIPTKDLHRFRCVWKLWYNLLNDPSFMSLGSQYLTSQRGFISLESLLCIAHEKVRTENNFVFFDFDKKEEKLIPFRLPPEIENLVGSPTTYFDIKIEDSFNGLLLISFRNWLGGNLHKYFIYNLVTACWLYIGTSDKFSDAFLVYDPIISKYKVVEYSRGLIHILGDMFWSCVLMPYHLRDFWIDRFCRPVFVNYCLYWTCDGELLRLDAASTGKLSTIKLPKQQDVIISYRSLVEMGGLLWFFQSTSEFHRRRRMQLWYLKKKKNGTSGYEGDDWVMMFDITLMTSDISLQQLETSTRISSKSQSSPVLLKTGKWIFCHLLFAMDRECTYLGYEGVLINKKYVYSYDTESNQKNLIYAPETNQSIHYWHGNNTTFLTQRCWTRKDTPLWWGARPLTAVIKYWFTLFFCFCFRVMEQFCALLD